MLDSLNLRNQSILNKLPDIAKKSLAIHTHGSVLIKNGKPVAWGFNSVNGNTTIHAEPSAILNYLIRNGVISGKKEYYILRQEHIQLEI